MNNKAKPVIVILLAVAAAAGGAAYLGRGDKTPQTQTAGPSTTPRPGGGRIRGAESAPITLVEYGDYQCPICLIYHPLVQELLTRYPDQIKLEFHHYPLAPVPHENALAAAIAAEAAGDQGRYFEMHDLLFETQRAWEHNPNAEAHFLTLASRLGLNASQFKEAIRKPETQQRVLEDVGRARALNIGGVPAFFVNGQPIEPLPNTPEQFAEAINARKVPSQPTLLTKIAQ